MKKEKIKKKCEKNKKLIITILLLILLFSAYKIYGKYEEANPDINYNIVSLENRDLKKEISIDGEIVSDYEINLASEIPGIVSKTYVKEGDFVKKGQLLMKLKDTDLRSQVSSAYVNQKISEVSYEKVEKPNQNLDLDKAMVNDNAEILEFNIQKTKNDIQSQIDNLGIYLSQLLRLDIDDYFDHTEFDNGIYSPSFTYRIKSEIEISKLEEEREKLGEDFKKYQGEEKDLENSIQITDEFKNMVFNLYQNSQGFLGFSDNELEAREKYLSSLRDQLVQKRNSLVDLKTSLANLEKQLDSNSKSEKKIENIVNPIDLKLAQEKIRQARVQTNNAYTQLQKTNIRATRDGVVAKIYKEDGEYVNPSSPLIKIISKEKYVKASIPEIDIAKIKIGDEVDIQLDSFKNKIFKGKINLIYPEQKDVKGIIYYEVKINLMEEEIKNLNILPGMSLEVFIKYEGKDNVLSVERGVAKKDEKGYFVEILNNERKDVFDSKFIKKYFNSAFVGDDFLEIPKEFKEYKIIKINNEK